MSAPEHDIVAAVRAIREERDELRELLAAATADVIGTSPVDGGATVRIPRDVMARVQALAGP